MNCYRASELNEARDFAARGGQALHCHRFLTRGAPRCFVAAVNRGEDIGHLFDLDTERLIATAKSLGVRVLFIDKRGTPSQHIDLCGKPMKLALEMCANPELDL